MPTPAAASTTVPSPPPSTATSPATPSSSRKTNNVRYKSIQNRLSNKFVGQPIFVCELLSHQGKRRRRYIAAAIGQTGEGVGLYDGDIYGGMCIRQKSAILVETSLL